jgi:hypothetical protein
MLIGIIARLNQCTKVGNDWFGRQFVTSDNLELTAEFFLQKKYFNGDNRLAALIIIQFKVSKIFKKIINRLFTLNFEVIKIKWVAEKDNCRRDWQY